MDPKEIKPSNQCPSCEGEGIISGLSSCCGARPRGNGDNDSRDFGICPDCGDHCEYETQCEECNGSGLTKTTTK